MTIANDIAEGLSGAWQARRRPAALAVNAAERELLWVYLRRAALTTLIGWNLAGLYMLLAPVTFVSRWTLIMPGESHSTTMTIDSVGQASSQTNSPFGSVSLSPKVVYKEIALSDRVREAAAKSAGMSPALFGRPTIKLIDETSLLQFEIGGSTAEMAHDKAVASLDALNDQLETLRRDEVAKRAEAIAQNVKSYRDQVDSVRRRITEVSLASGLVSVSQFNENVASLAQVQRKLVELTGEAGKMDQEQTRLIERMGLDAASASIALRLAGDASLSKVVTDFADANSAYTAESMHLGPSNSVLINLDKRRLAAVDALKHMIERLSPGSAEETRAIVMLTNLSRQAELLQVMVRNEAALQGKRKEIDTVTAEKNRLEIEVARLSEAAAKLEDLQKEHLLAEAVYSSAVARVDTSKSELYGAYPIIQVLAPPTLPDSPEQPKLTYALAAGVIGTVFSALTWGLSWLHAVQMRRRRKKQ